MLPFLWCGLCLPDRKNAPSDFNQIGVFLHNARACGGKHPPPARAVTWFAIFYGRAFRFG
jgi:hypothetical protein